MVRDSITEVLICDRSIKTIAELVLIKAITVGGSAESAEFAEERVLVLHSLRDVPL
jgi:hypothetical protein